MAQPSHNRQELLKQNFELTLILIFIGLAFGLVGLVVPTAAVMSVVVISIGVIVGFVSYRDAFIPQPTSQVTVSTPTAQKPPAPVILTTPVPQRIPASSPTPQLAQKPAQLMPKQPAPTLAAPAVAPKIEQKPAPQSKPLDEALPRLPKIQRLPESSGATFPAQAKPPTPAPQPVSSPASSELEQSKAIKPRKTRARKTVELSSIDDEKHD